jgi:predicted SAM-dependent methyltransferase
MAAARAAARERSEVKTFLHVGCGQGRKNMTTATFAGADWRELRLDIDEAVGPDIVGSMTDMNAVAGESIDAIFSSHNIEHLYPHEVPLALSEFLRVLTPGGFAVIACPDLQSVAELVAADKLAEEAYVSPAGPITALDMIYGHRPQLAAGNLFMAHHCGFTQKVLTSTLLRSGFKSVASRRAPGFNLWAVASKIAISETELRTLAASHFPP